MNNLKNWIWFSKRQVPFFQNDTEPKLFPNEYVKYIPKSSYDELKSLNEKLEKKIKIAIEALEKYDNHITKLYISNWENQEAMRELVYECPKSLEKIIKEN